MIINDLNENKESERCREKKNSAETYYAGKNAVK